MMPTRNPGALIGLAALFIGACSACSPAGASGGLPRFDSLESAHQAVDELIGCEDEAPESTRVHNPDGLVTTNSVKCTQSVEVFHFDSERSKTEIHSLLADAEGTVRFAEGENWFVVDLSDAAGSTASSDPRDLAGLAEELGARYTEVK
jgi:hypothetical protein